MEYAIAIGVTLIFAVLYFVLSPKVRDEFSYPLDDEEYHASVKTSTVKDAPKRTGGKINSAYYQKQLKKVTTRVAKIAESQLIREEYCHPTTLSRFEFYSVYFKKLITKDFTDLQTLPSINGEIRLLMLLRFAFGASRFNPSNERISALFSAQNAVRELTYPEIAAFKTACDYVVLEKLGLMAQNALKVLKSDKEMRKKYQYGNHMPHLEDEKFYAYAAQTIATLDNLAEFEKSLNNIDELNLYLPYSRLTNNLVFAEANESAQRRFLLKISELSDKENLNESAYTERLLGYLAGDPTLSPTSKRVKTLRGRSICFVTYHNDVRLLAATLKSREIFDIHFGDKRTKNDEKMRLGYALSNSMSVAHTKLDAVSSTNTLMQAVHNNCCTTSDTPTALMVYDGERIRAAKAQTVLDFGKIENCFGSNLTNVTSNCTKTITSILPKQFVVKNAYGDNMPPNKAQLYVDDKISVLTLNGENYQLKIVSVLEKNKTTCNDNSQYNSSNSSRTLKIEPISLGCDLVIIVQNQEARFEAKWFESPHKLGEYASFQNSAIANKLSKEVQFNDNIGANSLVSSDFNTILNALGLKVEDNTLYFAPNMPFGLEHATIRLDVDGKERCLEMERGECEQLYFGDTRMHGIKCVATAALPQRLRCVCKN